MPESRSSFQRRSFLTKLGAGMTVAGTGFTAGLSPAGAQTAPAAFRPARHAQDDWMDALPGGHRLVIDTTTPNGFAEGIAFAGNFLTASASGYKLADRDSAVIIVARHFATAYAYTDAIWAKYGKGLPAPTVMNDPKTGQRPTFNLFNVTAAGYENLPNRGTTINSVVQRGVHIAVCQMATGFFAGILAQAVGGTQDAVYNEIVGHLVGNTHMVSAGIVAVNRAQERGYTLASAG
jgi:hypothetical protein